MSKKETKETTYLNVVVWSGGIRKEVPKGSTVEREIKRIMKEGIWTDNKKEYYPPHSIWCIQVMREDT